MSRDAFAQPPADTVTWVSVRAIRQVDTTWGHKDRDAAYGLAVGIEDRQFSVALLWDLPSIHEQSAVRDFQDPRLGHLRSTSTDARRSASLSALLTRVVWLRHASISLGGGYTRMRHWSRHDGTLDHLDAGGAITKTDNFASSGTYTWRGFVFAASFRYAIMRHSVFVAELDHHLFIPADAGNWIFRPSVGYRWNF